MSMFSVDTEFDGSNPYVNSMIEIGAVLIDAEHKLDETFYGTLRPIHNEYSQEALNVTGYSREQTMEFDDAATTMQAFYDWIMKHNRPDRGRPRMLVDNPGCDWMYVNPYFHTFCKDNPFGYSHFSLTSAWQGFVKSPYKSFKHLRITKHTHNPVDDAKGNAEAFIAMIGMGYQYKL